MSDYPPPAQLFQDSTVQSRRASTPSPQPRGSPTSQPRGSQTSQPRGSQTSQPRGSQTSATRQPQSQSQSTSEAQNSQTAEDSEDEEFPHVEPTLSKDQMDVVNALLSQPGRERLTTLSPYLEPGTTWYFLILKLNFDWVWK